MDEGSPYLSRATAEIRRPLNEMVLTMQRHIMDLAYLIEQLGGVPTPVRAVQPEEQYLAFLTLKFLLPKLADAKKLTIERYENALRALKGSAPADVIDLLQSHLTEHRDHLGILQKAGQELLARK
jgi:hypothetical protein